MFLIVLQLSLLHLIMIFFLILNFEWLSCYVAKMSLKPNSLLLLNMYKVMEARRLPCFLFLRESHCSNISEIFTSGFKESGGN